MQAGMPEPENLNKGAGRSTLGALLPALQDTVCFANLLETVSSAKQALSKPTPNTVSVNLSFSFCLTRKEGKEKGKKKEFNY